MAVSVQVDLTTFSLAQDNTGGTWVGASGAFDSEVFYQGSASWYYQTPKNGNGDGNFTPTASVDMSAADTHLYWAMKCDVFTFCEALNTGATSSGLMVKIESGASDYVTWHIAGSDTWGGEWKSFVLDVNNTANTFSVTGTLDLSAVTKISFLTDNSNSGNIRIIDNTNINAVRFGTGLTLTGTTFNLADAAAIDELTANKYGVLFNIDGNVHSQGRITIGNGATTTTFNSTDEEIVFRDAIVSAGLYKYDFVGSGNVSVVKGFVAKGAGAATFVMDASDTAADLTLSGSTFIRAGLIDFASTSDVQNCSFNNCDQIVPSTGIFKACTISNFTGTTGSLLYPSSDTNISGLIFLICDNGVEYDSGSDATSPSFDDFTFDDAGGNYDVNNTSGSAVSIGNANGSNANSYNPGGDVVTFLANPVSFTVTAKKSTDGVVIEDAQINVEAGDALGDLFFEVVVTITSSGTLATVAHTAHGLVTGAKVNIRNAVEIDYLGAQTITVTGVNEYTYVMGNSTTSPATGTINATEMMVSGLSDVNGEITLSRPYTVDQLYRGFARKTDVSPFYQTANISGTLDKDLGATISANLTSDE